MDSQISFYLKNMSWNEQGAAETAIEKLQNCINFKFPSDYVSLMKEHNGGEGEIGINSWLCLFPIEELYQTNKDYIVMEEIPDYFLFAKDSADTGYAFNKYDQAIYSFGFMSNFKTDPVVLCGKSLFEFISYLYML